MHGGSMGPVSRATGAPITRPGDGAGFAKGPPTATLDAFMGIARPFPGVSRELCFLHVTCKNRESPCVYRRRSRA